MKIRVDHIQDKPFSLRTEDPVDAFPVLAGIQANGECTFTAPVLTDIIAAREFDHIRVSGGVSTRIELVCSRCLVAYEAPLASAFTIYFRKAASPDLGEEEETELAEEDLVSATYSGDEIDLTHEIEEQVAMEIPLKPLCSEECKGLCPVCGTDMNRGSCSCQQEQTSFKFSALKDFKVSR
ncbi:MAG TPA: DUF177 domain-containing protein [Desulfuromonadaceae bacterium]